VLPVNNFSLARVLAPDFLPRALRSDYDNNPNRLAVEALLRKAEFQ
jgi:hypothetical protein